MPHYGTFFFFSAFFAIIFFPSSSFPLSLLPTKWLAALEQCSRAPALCRTLSVMEMVTFLPRRRGNSNLTILSVTLVYSREVRDLKECSIATRQLLGR